MHRFPHCTATDYESSTDRRGVLMQYIPECTTLEKETTPMISAGSLWRTPLSSLQARIQQYLNLADARLETLEGVFDYLKLVESRRRRMYRPFPLSEFGLSLPYALNYDEDAGARFEMRKDGSIAPLPTRGVEFFRRWNGTQKSGRLAGFDPKILPRPGTDEERGGCPYMKVDGKRSHEGVW
ncbi:uncharacterized protein PAC_18469 [Phialocephala subalpina]|uniref:Uncharacterized protein n=1 Tax=Phialocephala subalpina TaxID=576137 RepID=A0A1L7XU74_9HELO|nr:uncharacterized protein PAC_18469 [Phialocephala subalpina]